MIVASKLPSYQYKVLTANGGHETGLIEAADEIEATRKLSRLGKIPIEIRPSSSKATARTEGSMSDLFRTKFDQARFYTDVAVMLEAGFNIDLALDAVGRAEKNKRQKKYIEEIVARVSEGASVSQALSEQRDISEMAVALVASGESTGQMATVFNVLAKDFTRRVERRSEVMEAILYPAFLIVVLFGTLLILAVYLVPAVEPIFENGGVEKPFTVSLLSGIGSLVSGHWSTLLIALILGVVSIMTVLRTRAARLAAHSLFLRMPVAGQLIRLTTISRYLHSISLLLGNGVALQESMKLAAASAAVEKHRVKLDEARESVSGGMAFWQALEGSKVFDDTLTSLIKLGEESNNLAPVANRAANLSDATLQRSISRILTFLTPAITIVLGLVVGSLVISVMTTLLSINELAIR